ncbi:hypothetical protein PVAND_011232 [Polypedilum vanderplanki]|uniref:Uncharacterized protein n=1 Tax=Polypedilum vanderplanki TaxID=319348 RepID=A0A9J6CIU9_POLVA|nr:hypothetical protein PVAND_011232 [Polypedilum vanderplanki]
MRNLIILICSLYLFQSVFCGPLQNNTDNDDRDVKFLIHKIKESMAKKTSNGTKTIQVEGKPIKNHETEAKNKAEEFKVEVEDEKTHHIIETQPEENHQGAKPVQNNIKIENKPIAAPAVQKHVRLDEHEDSSEVVHFNSNGESIEKEKAKLVPGVACKVPPKDLPTQAPIVRHPPPLQAAKKVEHNQHIENNKLHSSSSVEEHAIRFDHNGNTKEEYKDTEEQHDNHIEEKKKKRKVRNSGDRAEINNRLNEKVVNKQLQIRDLADEDSDEENEEEDIPLITIPMVDILRQYQKMAQGFESSTEEYSDELPQHQNTDHFDDPYLQGALKAISNERKKVKEDKKQGKKVKPAAKRVFEDLSKSDEEL